MPDFETIILRFRDLVTEENGTIARHQAVIKQYGYVWWAWWKKGNETLPAQEFSFLGTKAETTPVDLFLVDSGQNLVYRATCESVKLKIGEKSFSPEKEKTPEYYQDQQYYAWFKFTRIEPCDEAQLKEFTYVNCPSLFLDKNVDYSKFTNKKVYSITELVQQNRTVWFVRTALDTDLDNEIILLNSESIQPAYFNAKYYQASGNTLLWLSDLHLSDNRFESKKRRVQKTLAGHICEKIKTDDIAGLLISGDITSRAEPEGFELAKQLLKDLNNEFITPVFSENILICPGNHDFTREGTDLGHDIEPDYIYNKPSNTSAFAEFYKSIYNIKPNRYFATGRKILLSSGHMLEIAALNSLILQQYPNFDGHGYLSNEQLDFVAKQMGWDSAENKNVIRIVMMHHHYLPTCYTELIDVTRASSVVYDADRLMNWLVKYDVKLLLHGHKHKSFISQVEYPKMPEGSITSENMHHIVVAGMGGTGSPTGQNKFATIKFERNNVLIDFYAIYSDGAEQDHVCQQVVLPL